MALERTQSVKVYVTDVESAISFYTESLGMEKRADHPFGEKDRWVTVAPPGDSLSLSLRPADDEHRAGVDTGIQFGSTDVRATAEELIARGVHFTEFPAEQSWGSWMGEFADQDGNTYVLYDRLTD